MRTAYRDTLDNFAHDLIIMCDTVGDMMTLASKGLLNTDLQADEDTLTTNDELEEIRARCEERAVSLLALENPMAKDLRQVVSSIYIVEDIYRMGQLTKHIAKTARRRHPASAIPEQYQGYFTELSRLCMEMLARTRDILVQPDADVAILLANDDDAVDDIHAHLMGLLTLREWNGTTQEAVDMAMLCRYFERFADHTVNVAARIVFLITGLQPEQYIAKKDEDAREAEFQSHFADLERQFGRR